MSNVVPLNRGSGEQQKDSSTGVAEPNDYAAIYHFLRDLFIAGEIEKGAFFAGALIVQRFQEYRTFKCAYAVRDLASSFVASEDGPALTGLPFETFPEAITALQELHFKCGILNHYVDEELERENAQEGHFSLAPGCMADVDFTADTVYLFKFDKNRIPALHGAGISVVMDKLMTDYNEKVLTLWDRD
jgi:hypothetical protein